MTALTHFTKDPQGTIEYTVRWTAWLDGDTLTASSWILPTGTLTNVSESNTTTDAVIFLASGTVGTIYEVTNRITTAAGQKNDQTISILIQDK